MKILFLFPPGKLTFGEQEVPHSSYTPPLGILYLSRILEESGHDAEVIDFCAEPLNEKRLKEAIFSSDAVGMTVLTSALENSIKLSGMVKKIDKDIPLIIGGPHCSLYPKQSLLDLNADVSVEGEGEENILDIIDAINGKKELHEIHGIHYWSGGEVKVGKPPKIINNLDSIPFPAQHLVKNYDYGYFLGLKFAKGKFTAIITSRGCQHKCRFCVRQFIGMNQYRERSAENVVEEFREVNEAGYDSVMIVDDNFLGNRERVHWIMDMLIKEGIEMELWLQGRCDSADRSLYEKMRDAGVRVIYFGLESGNQDVLDYYNKGIRLDEIRKAVNLSREMGFFTIGSFILGAPFETKRHFENTVKFAKSLPLDVVAFFTLEYAAGSQLWEEAVMEGKIAPEEYFLLSDSQRGLSEFTKEEIEAYCKIAHKRFYFRPKYWMDQVFQAVWRRNFRLFRVMMKMSGETMRKKILGD